MLQITQRKWQMWDSSTN